MEEPTDEQIIKCLAEFEGHTNIRFYEWSGTSLWGYQDDNLSKRFIFDYLNNLDTMHRVEGEMLQSRELLDKYLAALSFVVKYEHYGTFLPDEWLLLHATANQRALAAYKVITNQEQ